MPQKEYNLKEYKANINKIILIKKYPENNFFNRENVRLKKLSISDIIFVFWKITEDFEIIFAFFWNDVIWKDELS